jgi:hypothetical protein
MRRLAVPLMWVLALLACSARAPHSASPPGCDDDTPEPGVCSPLRPTV